eukprot:6463199-Alexandrium_andersonii.AAC.1
MSLLVPSSLQQEGKALPATSDWVVAFDGVPVCPWALGSGASSWRPLVLGSREAETRLSDTLDGGCLA